MNLIPLRLTLLESEVVNESPRVERALLNQAMVNLYSSPGPTCTRGDNMTAIGNLVMEVITFIYLSVLSSHDMFFLTKP